MRNTIRIAAAVSAALLLPVVATSALAEIEVLESTAPGVKVRSKLADNTQFKLPDGTEVRILVRAANGSTSTKTIKGPYEGTVADYREKSSFWQWLVGPAKDNSPPVAGVRSARPKPEAKPDDKADNK
jgi:hypothetical protein